MTLLSSNLKYILDEGEVAKYIYGHDEYIVTNKGRVFSAKKTNQYVTLKGKVYKATTYRELKAFNIRGYKAVCLSIKNEFGQSKGKNCYIHDLVILGFYGYYDRQYLKIIHKNRKKDDNRLENLKLSFRKKDKEFIEEYEEQERRRSAFRRHLKEYRDYPIEY